MKISDKCNSLVKEVQELLKEDRSIAAVRKINNFIVDNKDDLTGFTLDLLLTLTEAIFLNNVITIKRTCIALKTESLKEIKKQIREL